MKKVVFLFIAIATSITVSSCSIFKKSNSTVINNQEMTLEDGLYAKVKTNKGDILLNLAFKKAPMTVANFVGLAEGTLKNDVTELGTPFYNGLTFHRVVKDFVIQGGDPKGNGSGGPGYQFPQEIHPDLKHDKAGTLAMANSGPNTNGCQFYITHRATPHLDGGYNVFGYTQSGMDVVNSIAQGDKIESIEIIRIGKEAKAFDAPAVFETKTEAIKAEAEVKEAKAKQAERERVKKADELVLKAETTDSGLKYIVHTKGTGPKVEKGNKAKVNYTLYLKETGKVIDSSVESIAKENNIYTPNRNYAPFELTVGAGQVIKGWDEGLQLFEQGTKATLIIPSSLGYGSRGTSGIPGNSTLVFDIEIVEVTK